MGNVHRKSAIINGQDIMNISGKYLIYHINGTYGRYLLAEDLIEKGNKIITENMGKNVDILIDIRGQTIINISVME